MSLLQRSNCFICGDELVDDSSDVSSCPNDDCGLVSIKFDKDSNVVEFIRWLPTLTPETRYTICEYFEGHVKIINTSHKKINYIYDVGYEITLDNINEFVKGIDELIFKIFKNSVLE